MLYCVTVVRRRRDGACSRASTSTRSRGLVTLAMRENELRVEYLGGSVRQRDGDQLRARGVLRRPRRRARRHVARPHRAQLQLLDHLGRVRLRRHPRRLAQRGRGVRRVSTVLEVVRSFSSSYFPNTWQLALGVFLLLVIRFLPRRHRLAVGERAARKAIHGALQDGALLADRCCRRVSKRFGAVVAADALNIACRRRARQPDRQQRRRQDHLRQHDHRLPQARRRRTSVLDGRDITQRSRRARSPRLGVARSFQIPQLCVELTVLDNMLVAAACHDRAVASGSAARRRRSDRPRADALLERFGLAEHRRAAASPSCRAACASCSTSRWR